jgi:hypothetical protein
VYVRYCVGPRQKGVRRYTHPSSEKERPEKNHKRINKIKLGREREQRDNMKQVYYNAQGTDASKPLWGKLPPGRGRSQRATYIQKRDPFVQGIHAHQLPSRKPRIVLRSIALPANQVSATATMAFLVDYVSDEVFLRAVVER